MMRCAGLGAEQEAASLQALQAPQAGKAAGGKAALCKWQPRADGEGLELVHQHPVKHITWHTRGEYFASVAPTGNTQARTLLMSHVRPPCTSSVWFTAVHDYLIALPLSNQRGN